MQFGLARTIAANRVQMHARANHIVSQNGGILLIGGAGGDDLRAQDRLFRGFAGHHV